MGHVLSLRIKTGAQSRQCVPFIIGRGRYINCFLLGPFGASEGELEDWNKSTAQTGIQGDLRMSGTYSYNNHSHNIYKNKNETELVMEIGETDH